MSQSRLKRPEMPNAQQDRYSERYTGPRRGTPSVGVNALQEMCTSERTGPITPLPMINRKAVLETHSCNVLLEAPKDDVDDATVTNGHN